jgi:hypothetical protein
MMPNGSETEVTHQAESPLKSPSQPVSDRQAKGQTESKQFQTNIQDLKEEFARSKRKLEIAMLKQQHDRSAREERAALIAAFKHVHGSRSVTNSQHGSEAKSDADRTETDAHDSHATFDFKSYLSVESRFISRSQSARTQDNDYREGLGDGYVVSWYGRTKAQLKILAWRSGVESALLDEVSMLTGRALPSPQEQGPAYYPESVSDDESFTTLLFPQIKDQHTIRLAIRMSRFTRSIGPNISRLASFHLGDIPVRCYGNCLTIVNVRLSNIPT